MNWDHTFMDLAVLVSKRSKDQSTKVGSVVVSPSNNIIATGYNGLPRGISYKPERYIERPEKYLWMEHAERNAIFAAAREGIRLEGSTIFTPGLPCPDCARAIIQAGIVEIVVETPDRVARSGHFDNQIPMILEMLAEAGVTLRGL